MDRRAFLSSALVGTIGALAGCAGANAPGRGSSPPASEATPGDPGRETSPKATPRRAATRTSRGSGGASRVESVAGVDLPVPENELSRGAPKDAIPAITEPAFADDWSGVTVEFTGRFRETKTIEPRLEPDDRVVGVEREGGARAYPLRILNWHEVVNDTFGGPLLVTYCPLCGSGITATRTVDGEETTFGVSGFLWNSALVMYDGRSDSLWSQIAATAIRGPKTGERLELGPSTITTWGTWREDHPDTEVLLPPPESNTVQGPDAVRDYGVNPYESYQSSDRIGVGRNRVSDEVTGKPHPKAQVIGITAGGTSKAYPLEAVMAAGAVNDRVGDLPVVVAVAADERTLVAYDRRVGGTVRRFERTSESHLRAGGSRWKITTGRAVDGPHEGTVLDPATKEPQMFWFAWADFHPETGLYEGEQ